MEELQVPTQRISVRIHTDIGEDYRGGLYIAGTLLPISRPEEILRVLNDERSFLPFQADLPVHEFSILNKSHIIRVSVEWRPLAEGQPDGMPYEELDLPGANRTCRMLLDDGTRIRGELHMDTPLTLSRLVDKLNHTERFLHVVTEDGVEFVHADHVVCVG